MIVEARFWQGPQRHTERATIGSASELVAFVRRQGIEHQADDVTAALLRGVSPVEAGWVTFTIQRGA